MAVTFANILAQATSLASTSFTTSSLALTGGRLYLLAITSDNAAAAAVSVPTVTQSGATWDLVAAPDGYGPSARRRTFLFRCQPASNVAAAAITIEHTTTTLRRIIVTVSESSADVLDDTAGNGAGCLPQAAAVATGDGGGAEASMSATLGAFDDAGNATWSCAACVPVGTDATHTPGDGFAEISDLQTGGFDQQAVQYRSDPDTSVTGTWSAAFAWILMAVEVAAEPVGSTVALSPASLTLAAVSVTAAAGDLNESWNFDGASPLGGWDTTTGAVVTADAALDGSMGVRLDPRTGGAILRRGPFGVGYRWVSTRFYFRLPLGSQTENAALLRVRNTNPLQSGGGGHADIWVDAGDDTIRGDLQPADSFLGPAITAGRHGLEVVAAFLDDGTSAMKARLDAVEVANFSSTLTDIADVVLDFRFGENATRDFVIDVDSVEIVVSTGVLDYLGPLAAEVALVPATLALTASALTPAPGPVTVALQPATLSLPAVAVQATPGQVTVALQPAVLTVAAVTVDPQPGQVTVVLTPAVLTFAAQPLTVAPSPTGLPLLGGTATTRTLTGVATTRALTGTVQLI